VDDFELLTTHEVPLRRSHPSIEFPPSRGRQNRGAQALSGVRCPIPWCSQTNAAPVIEP
jgi:hypothetical protein